MSSSPNGRASLSNRSKRCSLLVGGVGAVKRHRSWNRLKASSAEGASDTVEPLGSVVSESEGVGTMRTGKGVDDDGREI